MVNIVEIEKRYKKKQVLFNVNFCIEDNTIVGLVGPNGAGKSTLMRIICDINKANAGIIEKHFPNKQQICISSIFEFNGLYPQFTPKENLEFYINVKKRKDKIKYTIDEALEQMNLTEQRNIKTKFLSKGMQRKVALARAIITDPDFLILDEPFDGLDIESHNIIKKFLSDWVKKGARSVLLTSHIMSDIETVCTNMVILNNGRVILNHSVEDIRNKFYSGIDFEDLYLNKIKESNL